MQVRRALMEVHGGGEGCVEYTCSLTGEEGGAPGEGEGGEGRGITPR